jgi:hypothetical protein
MNVQYKVVVMGIVMAALITGVTVSSVGTAFAGGDKHHGKNGVEREINQKNDCSKGADCKNWGTIQDHIFIQVDGKDKKYGGGGPHDDTFGLSVPEEQNNAGQQQ